MERRKRKNKISDKTCWSWNQCAVSPRLVKVDSDDMDTMSTQKILNASSTAQRCRSWRQGTTSARRGETVLRTMWKVLVCSKKTNGFVWYIWKTKFRGGGRATG